MQVPHMGSQQSEDSVRTQAPAKNINRRSNSNSGNDTKNPESLHGGSLFQRAKWEPQESMQ